MKCNICILGYTVIYKILLILTFIFYIGYVILLLALSVPGLMFYALNAKFAIRMWAYIPQKLTEVRNLLFHWYLNRLIKAL